MVEDRCNAAMSFFPKQTFRKEPAPWFSTSELLEYLGISKDELDQREEIFVEGFHYKMEDPSNPQSQILWRIDRVDELLRLPIPPLEREAMLNAVNNRITCHD